MRKFLALAGCLIIAGCAGWEVAPPQEAMLQSTHDVDLKKDEIYSRVLQWMAKSFNDSKSVIEYSQKEEGKIIGKGNVQFTDGTVLGKCRFTLEVDIKDGKFRTTYSDWQGLWGEDRSISRPIERRFAPAVKAQLVRMDTDLFNSLYESRTW